MIVRHARRLRLPAAVLLPLTVSAVSLQAADLAWDNAGPGNIWNTTDANWTGASTVWTQGDNASFGGSGETVTLGENITVNNLGVSASGYTIAGGGFFLAINGVITNTQTTTIQARIAGADLVKAGSSTLVLQNMGGANTYAGDTYIQAGTLQARNTGALATTTTVHISAGAVLDVRASQTISGLTGSGTVSQSQTNGTTTLAVSSDDTDSLFSGVIRDGTDVRLLALEKTGSGTLTLTGANTYTGGTTVGGAGALATGETGNFGAGDITVGAGASLILGNNASIGDLQSLVFTDTSVIALNFSGSEIVGSVQNSVTTTFLAAGTYDAAALNAYFGVGSFTGIGSLTISAVPEPSAAALLAGVAVLGLGVSRRRRRAA